MIKTPLGEINFLHLSDLHIAPQAVFKGYRTSYFGEKYWKYFLEQHRSDTAFWHESNFARILRGLSIYNNKIDHVIVTGDCVTCGLEEEFVKVKKLLLGLQRDF